MSPALIRYVLTAAVRDRFVLSLILALAVGTSLAVFMGSAASVEKDQFALVFAAGGLRILGVVGLVLFTVFFIRRSFEARDIEFLLARPLGRIQFLVSYAIALSLIALLLSAAQAIALSVMGVKFSGQGALLWMGSIAMENIIMVNVALFFSMVLGNAAVAAMAVFAFYVLARMMGQILGIIDAYVVRGFDALEWIMQGISAVMPRLDLMGQSSWLLYGDAGETQLSFVFLQGAVFVFLITTASLVDLIRRQF